MNRCIIQGRFIFLITIIFFLQHYSSIVFAQPEKSLSEKSESSEKRYERAILWGERFYQLHLNTLALKQFDKAHKIKPGAYFPTYRSNQLKIKLHQPKNTNLGFMVFDFNKPGILISALILVILFSFTSMVTALTIVLVNRNHMILAEKRKQHLREEYQTMLVNFLFAKDINEELIQKIRRIASTNINRRILIDQMIDLSITLTGLEKERLKELYLALKLDQDSNKKALAKKWHIKAKGFRELAFMNIHSANSEIINCLSSKNDVLRMEAQFAMVRLNPDNSFGFLDFLQKRFTLYTLGAIKRI